MKDKLQEINKVEGTVFREDFGKENIEILKKCLQYEGNDRSKIKDLSQEIEKQITRLFSFKNQIQYF